MRFAFVNDGVVKKIEDHDSIDLIKDAHLFQAVVDITDQSYQPQVGWTFEGGVLINKLKHVSPRQIRTALILSGVSISQIDAALDTLPEPTKSIAKVEWEFSVEFQRNRPLVTAVGQMLGWTNEQLDNLWKLAATL